VVDEQPRQPRLPITLNVMVAFFAFGTLACSVTVAALLFPHSALDAVWRLNPQAQAGFRQLGAPLAATLMAAVGTGCALAAIGLGRGREWGRRLAIVILSVNLIGDTVNAFARHDLRTLIGLPIGGAMIWLLAARRVRPTRIQKAA
jgi:hypothetical protein